MKYNKSPDKRQFYQTLQQFYYYFKQKMEEANMYSEVKIRNPLAFAAEADLDGSSDNPNSLQYQKSRTNVGNVKLQPIRVTLTDNARGTNQAQRPYQGQNPRLENNPQYQQPPSYQPTQSNRYSQNPQGFENASPGVSRDMNATMRESDRSSPIRNKAIKKGYEMANYSKAVQYQNTQSYRMKTKSVDGHDDYEPMSIWGSNQELKQFGLGIYLLFQFLKRLIVTLLLMSAVQIFALVASYNGTGLSTYTNSSSFTMYLSKFTLGNIKDGDRQTYLIITVCDIVSMFILLIFWIHWRSFQSSILEQMEKDHKIVNPVNYVVTVQNFSDGMTNVMTLQQQLKNYIDNVYKGAYQVQIVYNYLGRFDKFIQYDQQIEIVETEHQIIKQTNKNSEKLVKEEKKLNEIEDELQKVSQAFEPLYAFIHFRTLKAKMAFLNHCKRFKLQNTFGQAFQRAICCTPEPPQRLLFLGKFPIMLRNAKLSRPEQINWRNIDISGLSRFVRWFFSIFFVVISILITSSLIGFCTLYVASTSSCQNYVAPTGSITAQINSINTDANKFCFCNANIASMYTDAEINTFCSSISNKVLVTNILQVSASVISSVTNVILGIIIAVIAKYLLRPNSIPKEYLFVFWGSLISNFINTCVIPLLLNGNIFGVQFISYLKFIDFMDFNNLSIFKDFTRDWYALISPYYITFLIIGCFVSPLIGMIVFSFKSCFKNWRIKSKCEDNDSESPLVQKEANKRIASLQFDYAEQSSNIILLLFIGILYSGLMPLTIPILTIGMFWIFICKKTILLKYSIKIPADQTLNQTIINFLPFVILAHGLFSIWSHTATPSTTANDTIFLGSSPLFNISFTIFSSEFDRIFDDILMLAEPVLVAALIILDYTIINFFSGLANCCKDEFQMPIQWAAIENQQFSDRIQKVNILGSYKLANNPTYGHAIKAFKELAYRSKKQGFDETKDNLNPEFSR